MALGEIEIQDALKVFWREIRVGLICGVVLGLVNFVRIYLMNGRSLLLSFTVTCSLLITVVMSKSVGCLLPLIAKKVKLDPAIMAAPLITTIVDGASLVVFFMIAKLLLPQLSNTP
jgi:magnesium transporter